MPERSEDLEFYRGRFLDQLRSSEPVVGGHDAFTRYWRTVEREAAETDELGKLESWVKELARDKEKLSAVKEKLAARHEHDPASATLLQIVRHLLDIIEGIEKKVRRRRDDRRRVLGWLLLAAGPGVKKRVPDATKGGGKKKDEDEDEQVSEEVLAKPKGKDEGDKAKGRPARREKKLSR